MCEPTFSWPSSSYDGHPKELSSRWNWGEDESICRKRHKGRDKLQTRRRKGPI